MRNDFLEMPVSWGDFIDRIAVLEITSVRIGSGPTSTNLLFELSLFNDKLFQLLDLNHDMIKWKNELKIINEELFELDDKIREKDTGSCYGTEFVELVRKIYLLKDRHLAIKEEINLIFDSKLVEEHREALKLKMNRLGLPVIGIESMMLERDLKLNLGSGTKRIPGFLNIDYSSECSPDIVMNLEEIPWRFDTDSVSHIIMNHVLEHIGQTSATFLGIMKELYRVCRNDAVIDITVPHHAHDNFFSDPTHVRAVTKMTLELFDRELNLHWRSLGGANSPLALQCGVNFKIMKTEYRVEDKISKDLEFLKAQESDLYNLFIKYGRNIISEVYFQLRVIKNIN